MVLPYINMNPPQVYTCSLKKALLSLLAVLWNSAFKWVYLSLSCQPFASLLFADICKASSDNHFALLHFFFFGILVVSASFIMLWPSIHSSSGTLSTRSNLLSLNQLHCIIIRDFIVFSTFFNLSLNFAIRSSWSEPQSAPGPVFNDCIELLHLWLQII